MGKIAKRFDILKRDKLEFTQQGFLRIPVIAGRIGIQLYFDEDGNELREYRPASEVFSEATMASLKMIPVTNDHPTKMVNPDNAKAITVGMTSDFAKVVDDQFIATEAVIFDRDTIEDIKLGKVEVSLGYDVELENTPGEFNGEKYDVIQRKIINNHLAIVDKGRAGSEVRFRLDSNSAVLKNGNKITIIKKEDSTMAKVKIGDTEFELNEDIAEKVKDLLEENEKLKKDVEGSAEEKKKAEDQAAEEKKKEEDQAAETKKKEEEDAGHNKNGTDKNDVLQAKVDALEADNKKLKEGQMDASQVDEIARQRTKVLEVGNQVLDSEAAKKMDDMSTSDIKKAIVEAESGDKMDSKTDVYIDARFDHIKSTMGKSDAANATIGSQIHKDRKTQIVDSKKARQDKMQKDSEAWKQPIGRSSAN